MIRLFDTGQNCPVCGKPGECLVSEDGTACICPHVSEGSIKRSGAAGWLHILTPGQFIPKEHQPKPKPSINWQSLNDLYTKKLKQAPMLNIGLKKKTLKAFDIGWDGEAFTFPMRNAKFEVIGIQRRYPDGKKAVVKWSSIGLFIPKSLRMKNILAICEGLSDTATLHQLGIPVIGRFNCNSCGNLIVEFLKWIGSPKAILVGDNDSAGKDGINRLGAKLTTHALEHIKIWPKSYKDVREAFVKSELTKKDFYDIVERKSHG